MLALFMRQIDAKVVIVDAYGVFNFGKGISPNAIATFQQWLNEGKKVYILSNTTALNDGSIKSYEKKGVIKGIHYTDMMTSGQYAHEDILAGNIPVKGKKYFVLGTPNFKNTNPIPAIFNGSEYEVVKDISEADFIYCGIPQLKDDAGEAYDSEKEEDFLPLVQELAESQKPLVCANPDKTANEGGRFVIRQGTIAELYQKFGGPKFMEAAHIKDIIAHLRIILNPDDEISLNRVLMLLKGIGAKAVSQIIPFMQQKNYNQKLLPSKYCQSLTPLYNLLTKNDENNWNLQELVDEIIKYYKDILKEKYDDWQKREKDLEHFSYLATQYKKLDNFLSDLALEPPETSVEGMYKRNIKDDCLTISTIHSAKGLEWDSVFIIGAVDGRFPSAYSFNSIDEMEEELRLMYVATTRAKSRLFISYPIDMYDYASQMILTKPSRFLDNLDNLLEIWDIEEEN